MKVFADAWTGGFIGGTLAAVALALVCIAVILYGALRERNQYDFPTSVVVGVGVVGLVAVLVGWVWASWPPFAYDYHHWVDKRVRVEAVSKRQVSSDHGFFEKFVVRDAKGALYGVDDTRAALVKPGDVLTLRCKKAYQFGVPRSAHGWDCRWSA